MASIPVDLGGTMFISAPGIIGSYQHMLRYLGAQCPPDEALMGVVGPPLPRSFPRLIGTDLDVEEPVRLDRGRNEANGLFNGTVYPGILQALTAPRTLPARLSVCMRRRPASPRRSSRILA